jgi:transposase
VRAALAPLVRQLHALDQEIARSDRTIAAMARGDEMARRLMTIPGLGPVTASAIAASVQDVSAFSGPREFAAFLGLTPVRRQGAAGDMAPRLRRLKRAVAQKSTGLLPQRTHCYGCRAGGHGHPVKHLGLASRCAGLWVVRASIPVPPRGRPSIDIRDDPDRH